MTKKKDPLPPRSCAVCGAEYTPRASHQVVCAGVVDGKLSPCATTAQKARWYRAALVPEVAAKYLMRIETVRERLDAICRQVHDPSVFERPVRQVRTVFARRSLVGAPVVGTTDDGALIYRVGDAEVIGTPCPVCADPHTGRPGACAKPECQREQRRRRRAERGHSNANPSIDTPSLQPQPSDGGPWCAPPPSYDDYLPGAVLPLDVDAHLEQVDALGPALHGVLTGILRSGRGHDRRRPEWSLLLVGTNLTSTGWAVWLPLDADVEAVRGKTFDVRLRATPLRLTVGARAVLRLRPPRVVQTGRHRVRLTTITPVVMRALGADGNRYRTYPQTPTLWTALVVLAQRIGLVLLDPTAIGIMRVTHETHGVRSAVNTKRGLVAIGWSGDVVLDVNPLGRWLLEVAARVGLGGRTAYGFGRIAVRDEPLPVAAPVATLAPWEVCVDRAARKFAGFMSVSDDEARHALSALVEAAVFDHATANGCEVWRSGATTLIVQPTTMRMLRVIDVAFDDVLPPTTISTHAVDRYIERVLGGKPTRKAREQTLEVLRPLIAQGRPSNPYRGGMAADVPDAMLWVGPRTKGDKRSARLRFVVGTPLGKKAPEVLTVLPPYDAPKSDAIEELWRTNAA